MSAVEALHAAKAAGVEVAVNGEDLSLKASSPPPEYVLTGLSRNKAEIIALLHPRDDGWSAEDWQVFFDERAGIAEFDGELLRPDAEVRAFACCIAEWLNRNPVRSSPSRCLDCGAAEQAHDPLLPYGTEPSGHAWLHHQCWPGWYEKRKTNAVVALAEMGIEERKPHP